MIRNSSVHIRLSEQERQEWTEQSKQRGFLKVSEYVRYLIRRDGEKKK